MLKIMALIMISLLLGLYSIPQATAANLEEKYEDLNAKYKDLEKRLRFNQLRDLKRQKKLDQFTERLKIHGFLSAGVAKGSDEKAVFHPDFLKISNDHNFQTDTTVGLQFDFKVTDKWNAVLQIKSDLGEEDELTADWAYLQYEDQTKGLRVKAGRLRAPFYYYSQFLDVGFAYPWVRPPSVLYWVPFNVFDGYEITKSFTIGEKTFVNASFSDGNMQGLWSGTYWTFDPRYIVQLEVNHGNHNFRYMRQHSTTQADYSPELEAASVALGYLFPGTELADELEIRYQTLSYAFDNGSLISSFELSQTSIENPPFPETLLFNGTRRGAYWMIGYRFGKWLPSVTFSKLFTDDDRVKTTEEERFAAFTDPNHLLNLYNNGEITLDILQEAGAYFAQFTPEQLATATQQGIATIAWGNFKQQSVTLSTAYTLNNRVILKGEVQRFSGFGTGNPYAANGDFNNSLADLDQLTTEIDRTQYLYSLSVDAVF